MYFVKMKDASGKEREFEIIGYHGGNYWVYIDFVFPMKLKKICYVDSEAQKMSDLLRKEEFIRMLKECGWSDYGDAQHERINELHNEIVDFLGELIHKNTELERENEMLKEKVSGYDSLCDLDMGSAIDGLLRISGRA